MEGDEKGGWSGRIYFCNGVVTQCDGGVYSLKKRKNQGNGRAVDRESEKAQFQQDVHGMAGDAMETVSPASDITSWVERAKE